MLSDSTRKDLGVGLVIVRVLSTRLGWYDRKIFLPQSATLEERASISPTLLVVTRVKKGVFLVRFLKDVRI